MNATVRLAMAFLLVGIPAACVSQDAADSAATASPSADQKSQDKPVPTSPLANQDQSQSKPSTSSPAAEKPAPPKSTSQSAGNSRRKHNSPSPKATAVPVNESEPRKIVIHRGGASEPVTQIIPGMTLEESNRLRQEAQDLLAAADSDLKKLAVRELNSSQQETVGQIRHYIDVARSALREGDIQRAHTLAQKAQLLSDDLVTH